VVAGISQEHGLESVLIKSRAINQESFKEFIMKVHKEHPEGKVVLFMDNLSVHKASSVRVLLDQLGMLPVFNAPYSPQFNGIESYWSLLKHQYKKLLLQSLLSEEEPETEDLILKSIKMIPSDKVARCAEGGVNEMLRVNDL
jgi:transposase